MVIRRGLIGLVAGGLLAVVPARAASEKVLYSFNGGSDGAYPQAGLINVGGNLYGTTPYGGQSANCPGGNGAPSGCGTVFKVSRAGTETLVYAFKGGSDGALPAAGLINVGGTLYGTTAYGGGSANCPGGNGAPSGCGAVFKVTSFGTETVLYAFKGGNDGVNPNAGLVNAGGSLFGTTYRGASNGGTVFKVTQAGAETVVYAFKGGSDGALPAAGLIDVGGTLYGTTSGGGGSANCYTGCGTVFKLTRANAEAVVYAFKGASDGANPVAALVNVEGMLYGTTVRGGSANVNGGCGTVFKTTKAGVEVVLHAFTCIPDGMYPYAGLVNVSGTLYGTTFAGGSYDLGTLFSVTRVGVEAVVYSFETSGDDGAAPYAGLVKVGPALYGTTSGGGGSANCYSGCGTVFKVTP